MIKIEKLNNGFKVEGIDNVLYPDNGTLVFGANTVILVTDESDMVTFRSASNFDVLFSGLLENITIDGESVTKDNIVAKFQAVANVEPASKEDIDNKVEEIEGEIGNLSDEVALKANATDLLTLFDGAEYNSQTKKIVFKHGDTVLVQIDATDFIKDGMVSNVEIVDNKLVISFNTDSGKENIEIPLSEIFNPNDYYTKTQIDAKEQSVNASIALKANITDLNAETTARQEKDTTLQNGLDSLALNLANEINNRQDADTALQSNIDAKANAADVYTKTEADNKFLTEHQSLDNYYTKDNVYNKTESDAKYATQTVVNEEIAARIQRDSEIEQTLASKADKSDTYSKQEVDDAIANVDVSDQLANYETIANHNADKALLEASISLKANSADLATVATSGSYNDLSDKPTIPTDYVDKETFDTKEEVVSRALNELNDSIPTKVSDLANDAGYLTQHQDISNLATKAEVNAKQDELVSGTNIKTINGNSILGEGNIVIQGGGGEQQQADWNQTDSTAVDYIKNKPVFPDTSEFVTKAEYNPKEVAITEALTDLNENKADKTELPDVSTFATKSELNQSLTNYYTKTEIDSMIGNINTILESI